MGKLSNEIKTGIAVVASVLILIGIFFKTGDIGVKPKGYTVLTRFHSAAGIKKFAPVRLAGMEVGEVRDVKLLYEEAETVVEATIWVESKVKLRKDAEATMSSLGLMGEKYVEIRPGVSPEFVEAGGSIVAHDPVNFDEMLETASGTMKDIRKLAVHADELLVEAKPKIMGILTNLDGILAVNRPKIDKILSNFEVISENFKEFSEDVRNHPWKVLMKGKELTPEEMARKRAERAVEKVRLDAIEQKTREELLARQAGVATASGATADSKKGGTLLSPKR